MKRPSLPAVFLILSLLFPTTVIASQPSVSVLLQSPKKTLKMGDVPQFEGRITNTGRQPIEGLIVYLSLVSLQPGREQPVDLEDWSAQKAVRIDRLDPGKSLLQKWPMRLIQAGPFGAALTVIDPRGSSPVISALTRFRILPKPTVIASRILPVAVGVPLVLIALFGMIYKREIAKD